MTDIAPVSTAEAMGPAADAAGASATNVAMRAPSLSPGVLHPHRRAPSVHEAGISVLIPCFNEEGAIDETIAQVRGVLTSIGAPFEIIVIDDGSTDGTAARAEQSGEVVVRHDVNRGYGAALKTGLSAARHGWIAITDADGTYPVDALRVLTASCGEYDMVVGARTGRRVKIPLLRRPAKWVINTLANYLAGYKIPDLNSGLRVFRREISDRFITLFPEGFSFTTTITVASLCTNYRVKFVPIDYFKRLGKSSISPIRDTIGFTILVVRLVTYFKPLNVFLPPALFLTFTGFVKAVVDFIRTNAFGVGSSLLMLTGVQLMFMGLMADLILRRTKL